MYHGNEYSHQTFLIARNFAAFLSQDMSDAPAGVVYGVMGKVWMRAMLASKPPAKLPISGRKEDFQRVSPRWLLLCGTLALGSAAMLPHSARSQTTPSQTTPSQTTPSQTAPSQTTTSPTAPSQATRSQATPSQMPAVHAKHQKKPTSVAIAEPAPPPPPTVAPSLFQQPPVPATVTTGNNELSVKAENSSLAQILHQVSSETGMKLDGLGGDERVFGSFGPGAPREVITSLLNGTSYNVMMVGDLPNGAPRELLLTSKASGGASPSANTNQSPAQTHNPDEETPDDNGNGNADDSSSDDAPPMQYTPPSIAPAAPPPRANPQLRNLPSPPQ
jgi:hypothetical protein